jgi:hypothetical protein
MDCRENICADPKEALAHITIAHYAEHHYEQYLDIPKTTDTRGIPKVLQGRSVNTRPIAVSD